MWLRRHKNNLTFKVFLLTFFRIKVICSLEQLYDGDMCVIEATGDPGQCVEIEKCEPVIKLLIENRLQPQHCGFDGFTPVVCCPMPKEEATGRISTKEEAGKISTKEEAGKISTKEEAGKISEKYCLIQFPDLVGSFVFGGKASLAQEFPHMAMLGYGEEKDIQWLCGGTLIADNFILTAAHCAASQQLGPVKFVRLGDLDIRSTTDDAEPQDFTVAETHVHPDFNAPSHYDDIALLKLNQSIRFSGYVKPACLYTNQGISKESLVATGWGKVDFAGQPSSHLLKVDLNYIDFQECAKAYRRDIGPRLANGILNNSQICAGGQEGKDTCKGDSGGPLLVKLPRSGTFYPSIVGVTSFGKACGIDKSIGVYTRVAEYLSWIEGIVWKEGIALFPYYSLNPRRA